MKITATELSGTDPRSHLAHEKSLFNQLRKTPRPACLFYVCDPCIVLGRSNRTPEWLHAETAEQDGIPVLRRFSGGGAVYLNHDVLNFSFLVPRDLLERASASLVDSVAGKPQPFTIRYIAWFRRLIIQALSRGGHGFTATGISDISLHGCKISGNAQRIAANLVLHHGTLMLRCPLQAIARYLPVPPNRPGISHAEFITGLQEAGYTHSGHELQVWLAAEFQTALSVLDR